MGYVYEWNSVTQKGFKPLVWDSPEPVCQAVFAVKAIKSRCVCFQSSVLVIFTPLLYSRLLKRQYIYPSSLEHKFKFRLNEILKETDTIKHRINLNKLNQFLKNSLLKVVSYCIKGSYDIVLHHDNKIKTTTLLKGSV